MLSRHKAGFLPTFAGPAMTQLPALAVVDGEAASRSASYELPWPLVLYYKLAWLQKATL